MNITYYMLTKPGIIAGNVITTTAGFLLASKGYFSFWLFLATVVGLAFVIASACVFNNYIDRHIDAKMNRTKQRALVTGAISAGRAILFAILLGATGFAILGAYTNLLTLAVAAVGFLVYVLIYSLWKCRTTYGTAIGSVAGAIPPLVGYSAVSNRLDLGAFILFSIVVLWQMPHFFAIATYRLSDYTAAGIPALPVKRGVPATKIRMFLYTVAFLITTLMLTLFGYTGYLYLFLASSLGLAWVVLSIKGFKVDNDTMWARQMFRWSLVVITVLCFAMSIDVVS